MYMYLHACMQGACLCDALPWFIGLGTAFGNRTAVYRGTGTRTAVRTVVYRRLHNAVP